MIENSFRIPGFPYKRMQLQLPLNYRKIMPTCGNVCRIPIVVYNKEVVVISKGIIDTGNVCIGNTQQFFKNRTM
jgi:hypothetical protein